MLPSVRNERLSGTPAEPNGTRCEQSASRPTDDCSTSNSSATIAPSVRTPVARCTRPQVVGDQRAAALPFADLRVQALLSVLVISCLLPNGFANKDVRAHLAPFLWARLQPPHAGQTDLRPASPAPARTDRAHLAQSALPPVSATASHGRAAHRLVLHARLWVHPTARNGAHHPAAAVGDPALRPYFDQVEGAIDRWVDQAKLVAQTRLIRIISDPFRGLRRENIAQ